jgi:hypothetical protein
MKRTPEKMLLIDSHHGIYSWQLFAKCFANRAADVHGVSDEEWAILEAGPDHEFYMDAASSVDDNAVVTIDGVQYFFSQDEDIWLIPVGMEWDEDSASYEWTERTATTPGPWQVVEVHGHFEVGYTDSDGDYWTIASMEPGRACEKDDAELIVRLVNGEKKQ